MNRLLAGFAKTERSVFDLFQGGIDFCDADSLLIPLFQDQALLNFTCGQIGLIREVIGRDVELVLDTLPGMGQQAFTFGG